MRSEAKNSVLIGIKRECSITTLPYYCQASSAYKTKQLTSTQVLGFGPVNINFDSYLASSPAFDLRTRLGCGIRFWIIFTFNLTSLRVKPVYPDPLLTANAIVTVVWTCNANDTTGFDVDHALDSSLHRSMEAHKGHSLQLCIIISILH